MTSIITIELLSIEEDGFHIIIPAEINGKKARLLIDTGASRTVFDIECINNFLPDGHIFEKIDKLSIGLGTNNMESHTVILKEISLGDIILTDYKAVVLSLKHVNQSYQMLGYPMIDGVLGGDLLNELKAVIDYRKRQIRWRSARPGSKS